MHLEIETESKNDLMERKEIGFSISGVEVTPSRKEVTKKIAAMKNAKEELIVIESLKQPFGGHTVHGKARIYGSKERLERVETGHLQQRGKPREKKKEEPAPAAPAPDAEGGPKEGAPAKAKEEPKGEKVKKEEKPEAKE